MIYKLLIIKSDKNIPQETTSVFRMRKRTIKMRAKIIALGIALVFLLSASAGMASALLNQELRGDKKRKYGKKIGIAILLAGIAYKVMLFVT